jgi:hypothetical protein
VRTRTPGDAAGDVASSPWTTSPANVSPTVAYFGDADLRSAIQPRATCMHRSFSRREQTMHRFIAGERLSTRPGRYIDPRIFVCTERETEPRSAGLARQPGERSVALVRLVVLPVSRDRNSSLIVASLLAARADVPRTFDRGAVGARGRERPLAIVTTPG